MTRAAWRDAQQPLWPEVVPTGFVVLPKRWGERTPAWTERARRFMAHLLSINLVVPAGACCVVI